jgi:hypothetical protein
MAEEIKKKSFFENVKWFFTEIMKIYSNEGSYFSKKRVESGIGFVIAEWGMIFFLLSKYENMVMGDFAIWASIQFLVAGYMINHIQKEKITSSDTDVTIPDDENVK